MLRNNDWTMTSAASTADPMAPNDMIPLEQTWRAYAAEALALPAETIPVTRSLGRVLAAPVTAGVDLPRFDLSALDGYCFRAADTLVASPAQPVRLALAQRIAAGATGVLPTLLPGTCARIFTGAALPPGADAVIAQERATRDGETLVLDAVWRPQRNVRRRGEEQRAGSPVADAGTRVSPGLLAALINAGATEVTVTRRPRIRVLTTGDEVQPAGTTLADGEIPDSNGPLIDAVLRQRGQLPESIIHVRDEAKAVESALGHALDHADLVITAGGASVGEHDFIVAAAQAAGMRRVFWQVAQKPGKPMLFAVRETQTRRSLLLGLPGNPAAVMVGLVLHLAPLLDRLEGVADPAPHWRHGRLSAPIDRDPRRARLLRMRLRDDADGGTGLEPLPHQDSHMLGNLAAADVLVWVDAGDAPAATGSVLRWTPLPG